MRVFVTGATGVVGKRALPLLIAAGHDVTAVARSEEKRAQVERIGAKAVACDLFSEAAVRQAVQGQEVVINLATHIPATALRMALPWEWKENDRLRREASAILSKASVEA